VSARRPPAAVVSIAALDVRRRADHRSELTSQLLLGETVRVLGGRADGSWWRIENHADGYRGWVRVWGLIGAPERRVARWRALARGRVVVPLVRATVRPGAGAALGPLYWNCRVIAGRTSGRWRQVELPSGARGWVPARALAVGRRRRFPLAERVQALLGTPYLWGGRTALGFDCSGLTQQLLVEQGVALPRDAAHQFRASRRLEGADRPGPGDLVFFKDRSGRVGHVGLLLGGDYYVQARGVVRVGSLDPGNPLYDKTLHGTIAGIMRPLSPAPRRARGPGGRGAESA
jgi:hypothetical protein